MVTLAVYVSGIVVVVSNEVFDGMIIFLVIILCIIFLGFKVEKGVALATLLLLWTFAT